jgi:hypothetical protein
MLQNICNGISFKNGNQKKGIDFKKYKNYYARNASIDSTEITYETTLNFTYRGIGEYCKIIMRAILAFENIIVLRASLEPPVFYLHLQ